MALEQYFSCRISVFFMHSESFAFMLSLITKASCRSSLDAHSKHWWDPHAASLKPVNSFVVYALNYELNVHSYILISLMNQSLGRVTDFRAAAVWALWAKVSTHLIYHTNDQFWNLNTGAAWKIQRNVLMWWPRDRKTGRGCPLLGFLVLLPMCILACSILKEEWRGCYGCGSSIMEFWFYREGPSLSSGSQIILMPIGLLSYCFVFVLTKTEMCS